MKPSQRSLLVAIGLVSVAGLAFSAGYWWPARTPVDSPTTDGERKILYWHDPMVPGYRSDKPGRSPFMDMDLVPVYADQDAGADEQSVRISPAVVNNLGVRTATIEPQRLTRQLRSQGYILRNGRARIVLDIFDRDADWLRPGLNADITVQSLAGQSFRGVVTQVDPDIDIGARSWRVMVRVEGDSAALRANMSADVVIRSTPTRDPILAVPRDAVIRTAQRTEVVRALDAGRFQPTPVTLGREFGDWLEVRSGLNAGDQVVISSQFLIDSESNLRSSLERLQAPTTPDGRDPSATDQNGS